MITYKDVRLAINAQLTKTGIEINSRDVQEGFKRPSFFVHFDNSVRSADQHEVHKSLTVYIYYFPSDRSKYSIEVMEMQETLEELFDLKLIVKDRHFNVDEVRTDLVDGVLNASFDLAFYDARDRKYGVVIAEVDGDGNLTEGNGTPVEVPVDEIGNPILDGDMKPVPIEKMEHLEIEKAKE
ncbi:phage tail terminator family protein [Sporosarcina cyprini]|uniref:phage tail terminator family protein n=1 Tax=Sporosarcina cyprini TaxID=2910523 RepID=UPI001EE0C4FF|nr:hypothetical protein [Sporosarcina cyprini]MCG3089133.1 hypothetical protein [Sporosarcina cyprini]